MTLQKCRDDKLRACTGGGGGKSVDTWKVCWAMIKVVVGAVY